MTSAVRNLAYCRRLCRSVNATVSPPRPALAKSLHTSQEPHTYTPLDFLPGQTMSNAAESDDDLERLFEDLFASSPSLPDAPEILKEVGRLTAAPKRDLLLALDKLQDRLTEPIHNGIGDQKVGQDVKPKEEAYIDVLRRLEAAIVTAEEALPTSSKIGKAKLTGSLNLATKAEWEAVLQAALDAQDHAAAQRVLDLMERSGVSVHHHVRDRLLKSCSQAGDIIAAEGLVQAMKDRGLAITENQRHLHVQTFVSARQYFAAQSLIHSYEEQSLAPAERTYRTLIRALFSSPPTSPMTTRYRALGWDLFAHMRYVAHPNPSAETYTAMIRACADATIPSAERALDLFHEMTIDNRLRPTVDAYNAVMLTCARSPKRQEFAHETFRLGKQLLDEYRHMSATSPEAAEAKRQMRPTLETFKAMLESAKRTGDLARGRWILAELMQARECVDEQLMGHVFHLYATFKPPFARRQVVLQSQPTNNATAPSAPEPLTQGMEEPESMVVAETEDQPALMPQTRSEVLREADVVFQRVINGMELGSWGDPADEHHPDWIFSQVKMTTNLLNAYIAVQCNHGMSLKTAVDTFNTLYVRFQCPTNGQSFTTILERLALPKRGEDRAYAKRAAEGIWKRWIELCDTMEGRVKQAAGQAELNVSARRVEKMWATMIRIITLSGDTQRAMELVGQFHKRYPPQAALPPNYPTKILNSTQATELTTTKSSSTSIRLPETSFPTRVALEAARQPLVRLTTNSLIPDNTIPPFLTFEDVEILHHRLVIESTSGPLEERKERVKDVKHLTWLCRSYGGALQKRRNWVVQGA